MCRRSQWRPLAFGAHEPTVNRCLFSYRREVRVNVLRRPANIAAAFLIVSAIGIAAVIGWQQRQSPVAPLPAGTIGAVDAPAEEALTDTALRITGWALDPAGSRRGGVRSAGPRF